jgi:muramoyltetrapeptide carboxypeptidase
MDLAPGESDALTRQAPAVLATPAGATVTQTRSSHWHSHSRWTDFADVPECTYQLTEPTMWRALDGQAHAPFSGRLIGGCIDTLMHLAGGEHGDVAGFIQRCGGDGTVLYLENAEQSPTGLVRALHRLRWAGWFDGLAGLLIGRSAAPDTTLPHELRYDDALRSMLGMPAVPGVGRRGHRSPPAADDVDQRGLGHRGLPRRAASLA